MAKKQIFKLQRAQFTSHPAGNNLVLAYNKNRTIMGEFPMSDDDVEAIFGDEQKVFVMARQLKNGKLDIDDHAEWQDW